MTADFYARLGLVRGEAHGKLARPAPQLTQTEAEVATCVAEGWELLPSVERCDIRDRLRDAAKIFGVRPSMRLARAVFARLGWGPAETHDALHTTVEESLRRAVERWPLPQDADCRDVAAPSRPSEPEAGWRDDDRGPQTGAENPYEDHW